MNTTTQIPPHQQRVIDERNELEAKVAKLSDFIDSNPIFQSLSTHEQGLLRIQADLMRQYLSILNQRIALFNLPTT
jgi:hypothetical protein